MTKKHGLISGILVMVTTILLYTILVKTFFKVPMAYITLLCVLASEAAATLTFTMIKCDYKRIFTSIVFAIQAILTIIASIVFINLFVFSYKGFFTFYTLSLVASALAIIFLYALRGNVDAKNQEFKDAKSNMADIRMAVNKIINSPEGAEYKKELKALDENLRFTDDSVQDSLDIDIECKVGVLATNIGAANFDVLNAINEINDIIKQRNFEVKSKKTYK